MSELQTLAGAGEYDRVLADDVTGADHRKTDAARAAVRRQIAFYASTPAYRDVLGLYGLGDLADRLRKTRIDAFIDTHGAGYVKLAGELGVPRDRIQTIIDFAAVREYGVNAEGSNAARNASVLAELAGLVASGDLEVPIAATFPLDQVRAAFSLLGQGHIRGKIVLLP